MKMNMNLGMNKMNIVSNFCKTFLKMLSIEAICQISNIQIVFINDKLKLLAKRQIDRDENRKIYTNLKRLGQFKIKYLKKKYPHIGYYDSKSNTVYSSNNQYILSHEICHATSILNLNKQCFNCMSRVAYFVCNNFVFFTYLSLALNTNQILYQHIGKYVALCSNVLSKLTKISSVFVLAEEAQASIRAVCLVKRILGKPQSIEAAKLLATAYGTYVWSIFRGLVILPAVCKWSYGSAEKQI